jgi:hypothetical protein
MVIAELREQLLAQKRERSEQESTHVARECSVVEREHSLQRACMECNTIHDQVMSVRGDYLSRLRTITAGQ